VRLLDGGTEVARHARRYDRGQRVEEPAHLAALACEKRHAHVLRGRDRLRATCLRRQTCCSMPSPGAASRWPRTRRGCCRLLDQYGAAALDWALHEALARGAVSAPSVAHLLDQRARARRQPLPLAVVRASATCA
jgi:hypothetical protein